MLITAPLDKVHCSTESHAVHIFREIHDFLDLDSPVRAHVQYKDFSCCGHQYHNLFKEVMVLSEYAKLRILSGGREGKGPTSILKVLLYKLPEKVFRIPMFNHTRRILV